MSEYDDIMAQVAELQAKAAGIRENEIKSAIVQIKELMAKFNITISDLQDGVVKDKKKAKVAAQYRDPVTGNEWSGRGRAPRWLDGKNKEGFKI